MNLKTTDIEIAIARNFNYRTNIIVPNVFWGLGLRHECDILVVSKSGYATEIEIKISKSDIKADLKKKYAHQSGIIRMFYYAVPEHLKDCEYLPLNCGLITVDDEFRCKTIRAPRFNRFARKLSDAEIKHLLHMGCMRIWSLKEKLNQGRKYENRNS